MGVPLGPKSFTFMTLLFQTIVPDNILFYIADLVSNYFLGYVISCVVAKHNMWTWDHIT